MTAAKSSAGGQLDKAGDGAAGRGNGPEAELEALTAQRAKDLERLREMTIERDRLRFELSERNGWEARELAGQSHDADEADDDAAKIDGWLLKAAAVRALHRKEAPARSLMGRLLASLALRFARRAARRRDYASAEVFYQVILLLAPRAFIWRQTGNMMAGQGLYQAAIDCFDRAIEANENDAEAWHARGVAMRRSDDRHAGADSIRHALELDPSLANRNEG